MVSMKAPTGLHEAGVEATAGAIAGFQGRAATRDEVAEMFQRMPRHDYLLYFVPHLLDKDSYLKIIQSAPELYEEAKEFENDMAGDELLSSLQSYALDAPPKVDMDYSEIGYPANIKNKLLTDSG